MSEEDKSFRMGMLLAFFFLMALILAVFAGHCESQKTARTAMEHGYVNDRGEWRKLEK